MDEKLLFVQTAQRGVLSMTELCRAFGVSRKTGYKWLDRFEAEGAAGLEERTRDRAGGRESCLHTFSGRVPKPSFPPRAP